MALPSAGAPDCSGGLSARLFNNLRYDNPWKASQSGVAVGTLCCPTTPAGIGFRCSAITTGITGISEPTWPAILTNTVVDGGVTWTAQDVANPSGRAHTPTGQFGYVLTANDLDGFRLLAYDLAKGVCDELAADNEAWTNATLTSIGANVGFQQVQFRRGLTGDISLRGVGVSTAGTPSGTTVFTLPVGPPASEVFGANSTGGQIRVDVQLGGAVVVQGALAAGQFVSFSGISFSTT